MMAEPRSTAELLNGPKRTPRPKWNPGPSIFDDDYHRASASGDDLGQLPAPRPGRSDFPDIFTPGGDE